MWKWIGRIIAVVVVLLIVGLIAAYFYLDSIAKEAIERGGTYATGVDTEVDSVSLGLFGGTFGMKEFELDNPEGLGFQTDHFLELGEADLAVSLGSLRKDVVVVPRIHLADIDLNLERRGGKQNFDVILENLQKLSSDEPTPPEDAQQWVVNDLTISNVKVTATGEGLLSDNQAVTFTIPQIQLTDVKSDSLAELQGQVIKQVLGAVAQQAPQQVLGVMGQELLGGVAKVGEIGEATLAKVEQATAVVAGAAERAQEAAGAVSEKIGAVAPEAGKAVGEAGEKLGEVGKEAGDAAKQAGEKLQEGLGGLLGGGKKDDEPKPAPAE